MGTFSKSFDRLEYPGREKTWIPPFPKSGLSPFCSELFCFEELRRKGMPNPYAYPRPEYPRPDRQRGTVEGWDWVNLNGPWQFRFDGDRVGEKERWYKPGGPAWREQIIVPFCWESLAAWGEGDAAGNDNVYATRVFKNPLEVNRQNHRHVARYEVGWYRREITIPQNAAWEG